LLAVVYADYVRSKRAGWTSEELEVAEAIKRVVCVALQKERTWHFSNLYVSALASGYASGAPRCSLGAAPSSATRFR